MDRRRSAVLILLVAALLSGCAALSVQAPPGIRIPENASTVVVTGVSFDDARYSLIRQGWTIADVDPEAGILRTEPWAEEDGMNPLRITINAMPDGALVLRGQWAYGRYSRVAHRAVIGSSDQLEGWNRAAWNDNNNARQALLQMRRVASRMAGEVEVRR